MTQEEKAKAYDAAFEMAKECLTDGLLLHKPVKDVIEYIFPELKDSEDELTWLKRFIQEEIDCLSIDIRDIEDYVKLKNLKSSIAWLDKQCERENELQRIN